MYVLILLAILTILILIDDCMNMTKHRLAKVSLYNYLISGILSCCVLLTCLNDDYFSYDKLCYLFFNWKTNLAIAFGVLMLSFIFTICTYIYILIRNIYKRHITIK